MDAVHERAACLCAVSCRGMTTMTRRSWKHQAITMRPVMTLCCAVLCYAVLRDQDSDDEAELKQSWSASRSQFVMHRGPEGVSHVLCHAVLCCRMTTRRS